MSKLTELSALKMQLHALERMECEGCHHTLSMHVARQSDPRGCHGFDVKEHESKDPERARIIRCKCKTFCGSADEQLPGIK